MLLLKKIEDNITESMNQEYLSYCNIKLKLDKLKNELNIIEKNLETLVEKKK